MIAAPLWFRAEEHRQLLALRERLERETTQAGETAWTGGRPDDVPPTGVGPAALDVAEGAA